ncbi:hypothetical protein QAD02_000885 [Eretmocerus hayati]|uniref:Uncharacterized protein n=1 Tax=Eretmocerus hayati TaxID=131215 RepID=A0ACC2NG29_9HYME|nr:hypothetical protein QAD02_000885 [Eretmocerus hayati]
MKQWAVAVIKFHIVITYTAFCSQKIWKTSEYDADWYNNENLNSDESFYSGFGSSPLARSALLERQEQLQYKCDQMTRENPLEPIEEPKAFENLLVDDRHRLLYCYVPKVACTNWKRVLMIATGKWKGDLPQEIPADLAHATNTFQRLSNLSMTEIQEKLATYNKLIVVRHPFERLLSAFRNKFETKHEKSSTYFQSRYGTEIIEKYRPNATEKSLLRGDDVTFGEFVDFIVEDNRYGNPNEHWNSISRLCHPCLVNYNLISKYETLSEDAVEILKQIHKHSVQFPLGPRNSEPTAKIMDRYYLQLSLSQLRALAEIYRSDLYLFDYSIEQVLGYTIV